jgi:hypothetical protein
MEHNLMLNSKSEILPFDVNLSLAAYPRKRFSDAMDMSMSEKPSEPFIGSLSLNHVQLCPQNHGILEDEIIISLREKYPLTQFRLHANVRVMSKRCVSDFSSRKINTHYWENLARASRLLDAPAYTAHAGLRCEASIEDIIAQARQAQDAFGCAVGIEGHYPTPNDTFLVSSWEEYRCVFESGVSYALDLSHLNILAIQSRRMERSLVQEMLACERCIEVHLSGNDGLRDQHKTLLDKPWWWALLPFVHDRATVFSESMQIYTDIK